MHEGRVVRAAGRMVVGSKVPTPASLHAKTGQRNTDCIAVFSGTPEKQIGPRLQTGAAVAIACAVAIGSTAAMTGALGTRNQAETVLLNAEQKQTGTDVTASLPETQPVQVMAISQTPLAGTRVPSLSPARAERLNTPSGPGFIRIAQQDAAGLNVENVFGPAGKPIRLSITLNRAKPEDYSFLMFRGLPADVILSAGFRLKESWAVSLRDLDNLSLETPQEYQGSFNLEVLLIKGRDTPAESRVITVEIVPKDLQLPATAAFGQPAPGPQVLTAAPPSAVLERPAAAGRPSLAAPQTGTRSRAAPIPEEAAMLARATSLLNNNDVSSARLLFEHLAKRGSAKAALAMGQTYDPAFFGRFQSTGLKPDIEKARQWYGQAADLGDQEAAGRLSALASR